MPIFLQWHTENISCAFRRPQVNFVHLVLFTIFVLVGSVPVSMLTELCLKQFKYSTVIDFGKKVPYILARIRWFFYQLSQFRLPSTGMDLERSTVMLEAVDLQVSGTITIAATAEEKAEIKDKLAVETFEEYWTLEDELKDCLTQSSKYMKAARLRNIQKQADFVLPSVEAERLLLCAKDDIKNYGRSELAIDHAMHVYFDSSETVKRARFRFRCDTKQPFIDAITAVRLQAESIKRDLESVVGDHNEVELLLFRKFLVSLFTGFQRKIAERHIYRPVKTISSPYWSFAALCLAIITLAGIYFGMLYFLFSFGSKIGSRAMDMWILVFVLSLLEGGF